MKRKIIKTLLFAFVICLMAALTLISAGAATVTKDKLVYETSGSEATLVECGTDAKTVTVPSKVGKYKVTAIGEEAFSKRTKLKSITLPSTVTEIGEKAFYKCTALIEIEIPSSVKKISAKAFYGCKKLKTVVVPKSVTSLGKSIFTGCSKATVYVISGSKAESYMKKQSGIGFGYMYMNSLTLNKTAVVVSVGESTALTAVKKPEKLYNGTVTYTSDNPDVVSVSASGVISGKKCGTAVITCTANDGSGKKAVFTVTVEPVKVAPVKVSGQTPSGYTLSWSAAKGATGYIISRYNPSSKTWTRVGDTTKTSYVFSSRSLGSSESYRVTAYAFNGKSYFYGDDSLTVTASVLKPAKVMGLRADSVTESSVSLSWTKVSGATGYKIYIYDSATDTYEYKWATGYTKATIGGLSSGSTYTFAVKSYFRTAKASLDCTSYSSAVSAKTLTGTVSEITVADSDIYSDRIILGWDRVEGADGYDVYIYDKAEGAYTLYKRVIGNGTLSTEVSGLTPGTAYNFRIKTYTGISESSWSEVFSFTTDYMPRNGAEGAKSFADAIEATKSVTSAVMLSKSVQIETENPEDKELLSYFLDEESGLFSLEEGRDAVTGMTLSQLVYPFGDERNLAAKDVGRDTMSVRQDGYGYSLSFTVDGDRAYELVCPPDFEGTDGFTLLAYEVEDAKVSAKITDGQLDLLEISVPVKLGFILDGEKHEISFEISHSYYFIFM